MYLGIDGGGTKTSAVVANENKEILSRVIGGTINYYSVGLAVARNNLKEIIEKIENSLGTKEFKGVFIGSSALDCKASESEIKEFTAGIINAEKIGMNSDVYVALLGCKSENGKLIVISGTGSMALLKCGDIIVKRGGWGHILGDEGSAYSISLSFLKKLVISYENGENEELRVAVCKHFGISSFLKLIDFIYNTDTTKDIIAGLCPLVLKYAEKGNELCVEAVTEECEALFKTIKPLIKKGNIPDVFLYGGVFQNSDYYRNLFTEYIKNEFPNVKIKLLNIPPEDSALEEAYNL